MTREEELVKYQLEQHQRNQEIDKETQNMSLQERAGFVIGVEWADQHPRKGFVDIEKACTYLESVFKKLAGYYSGAEYTDAFRKAMLEEEQQ